jgi:hypothetical protein
MAGRPMKESGLEALSPSMKLRVANLVLGVGQYQAHVHPRNWDAYLDDSFSKRQIARLLAPENMSEVYPLPPVRTSSTSSRNSLRTPSVSFSTSSLSSSTSSLSSSNSFLPISSEKTMRLPMSAAASRTIKVNIPAVIGDTSLSSAAWMLGDTKYSPMDLYDSCIVVFEVTFPAPNFLSSSSTILFPSSSSLGTFDTEKLFPIPIPPQTQPHFYPQTQTRIPAIPSARVFSARSQWFDIIAAQSSGGEDGLEPLFIPRDAGSQVNADEKTWIYWVPCAFDGEEEKWLQIKSSPSALPVTSFSPSASASSLDTTTTNAKPRSAPLASTTSTPKVYSVLGHQLAKVLDDAQLSGMLGAGKLNISLKNAQEVRGVVDVSRGASEGLKAFLR